MNIRNKSIISVLNSNEVLLTEGYDSVRKFYFYIPVGGGIEFGETSHDAAKRELFEELQVRGENLEFIGFHENIFSFQADQHHEIVFHFLCRIFDQTRSTLPEQVTETSGEMVNYSWYSKHGLEKIRSNIVPPQIYNELVDAL